MLKVAIVDDNQQDGDRVVELLQRFYAERGIIDHAFEATRFLDGEDFLDGYSPAYDLIFMDIEMERMDGLVCARRLRKIDREVLLVFTTNLAQYAAMGYDVDALGYLVKPLRYFNFALAMRRAEDALARRHGTLLWLSRGDERVAVSTRDLLYVEVRKHNLLFHATDGVYETRGALREYADRLASCNFSQCNRYTLVNLAHVRGLSGDSLRLDSGEELVVSRRSKKGLMQALVDFFGAR